MMQTRYTFEELQECPLPEGVDALRLESYLDDEEFEVCYKKLLFKHGFLYYLPLLYRRMSHKSYKIVVK